MLPSTNYHVDYLRFRFRTCPPFFNQPCFPSGDRHRPTTSHGKESPLPTIPPPFSDQFLKSVVQSSFRRTDRQISFCFWHLFALETPLNLHQNVRHFGSSRRSGAEADEGVQEDAARNGEKKRNRGF